MRSNTSNVYEKLSSDHKRGLLAEALLKHAPDLAKEFAEREFMTLGERYRVMMLLIGEMDFMPPDDEPTPRAREFEDLVSDVMAIFPRPDDERLDESVRIYARE